MAPTMIENLQENIVRFPLELRRCDLDALIAEEPDFLAAEALCDRCGIEIPTINFIECGEDEARELIATLKDCDPVLYQRSLRRMQEDAMAMAIGLCRKARRAQADVSVLRRRSIPERSVNPVMHAECNAALADAERRAAQQLLAAMAAAEWARGIDEVVSYHLSDSHASSNCTVVPFSRPV